MPAISLLQAAISVDMHQFRPTTDSAFIPPTLFESLDNGEFARELAARNVRIILGECRDEHYLYSIWFPPVENSISALRRRLVADYPRHVVDALMKLYYPDSRLPPDCNTWDADAFGRIYADMQVHKLQRGLVYSLATHGASHLLHRYRIEYRPKCVDKHIPPQWGVTHSSDLSIWFWGNGDVLEPEEKDVIQKALLDPLVKLVNGQADLGWGTTNYREVRRLKPDGTLEIWNDSMWDDGLHVWKVLREIRQSTGLDPGNAKL